MMPIDPALENNAPVESEEARMKGRAADMGRTKPEASMRWVGERDVRKVVSLR